MFMLTETLLALIATPYSYLSTEERREFLIILVVLVRVSPVI